MLMFLFADDLLTHLAQKRQIFFAGDLGTGKSSLAVAISYLMLQAGLIDTCVASLPLSWAIPAELCPPSNYVCILDELGAVFDNRSYGDKRQNEMRKAILAFPRKMNVYIITASHVSPDISFRSLVVQRVWDFRDYGAPLEIFSYGIDEGEIKVLGNFGVWDRAWLWRVDKNNPSPKYGHEYVPTGVDKIIELFEASIALAKEDDEPNKVPVYAIQKFIEWHRVGQASAKDLLSRPENSYKKVIGAVKGSGKKGSGGSVYGGGDAEAVVSGGKRFTI